MTGVSERMARWLAPDLAHDADGWRLLGLQDESVKNVRETLCRAQSQMTSAYAHLPGGGHDKRLLGRLIAACDRLRPLHTGGSHDGWSERCTPYCGCEKPTWTS